MFIINNAGERIKDNESKRYFGCPRTHCASFIAALPMGTFISLFLLFLLFSLSSPFFLSFPSPLSSPPLHYVLTLEKDEEKFLMRFLENPAAIYKEAKLEAPKEQKYSFFFF